MAHNLDRVPWHMLRRGPYTRENSRLRRHVVAALCLSLTCDIIQEASRYEFAIERPAPDAMVISDEVARSITPMMALWRADIFVRKDLDGILELEGEEYHQWQQNMIASSGIGLEKPRPTAGQRQENNSEPCTHDIGFRCGCILPRSERRAAAFRRVVPMGFYLRPHETCAKEYFGGLVMQSLLIAGEMQPFYNLGKDVNTNIFTWAGNSECVWVRHFHFGWGCLQIGCLWSYILLNALLALSDAGGSESLLNSDRFQDRATSRFLQTILCHGDWFERFHWHIQHPTAVSQSLWTSVAWEPLPRDSAAERAAYAVLRAKGLPDELVLQILRSKVRLTPIHVPGDPLHPDNRQAIKEYLELCWRIVVRCGVLQAWETASGGGGWASYDNHLHYIHFMMAQSEERLWREVAAEHRTGPSQH